MTDATMSVWTEGDVESDGVNVHYYRTGGGDKPPLLLAHGFTDNGLCWSRVARVLETDFDVVMVDARSHGESGQGPAGLKDLAGDMLAVISELDFERPAAMGHSVGAGIVAGLAAHFPDSVSRIVLEDPPWTIEPRVQGEEQIRRRREGFRTQIQSLADLPVEQIIRTGRESNPSWHVDEFEAWALSKQQVRSDAMDHLDLGEWTDSVPLIRCPALLVYAEDGKGIVSRDMANTVEAANERFSSHQIAKAGHNIRREQFEEFVSVAGTFLAR